MANRAAIFPALLIAMTLLIADAIAHSEDGGSQLVCREDRKNTLACEVQEMKIRIAELESILEERIRSSINKDIKIEEKKKLIEDMTYKVNVLETSLRDLKDDSSTSGSNIHKLKEDVQVLWAASRKNNFDIHILESKVQDAGVRLKALISQVEKMTNISTELWIQIRHLEQALQITETRILKARRRRKYTVLEVIKESFESHLSRIILVLDPKLFVEKSTLRTYLSQALDQLKVILSATKSYHHKLQEFIKQKMERNELTAPLANQEVVFFLASVAVTFPTLMAVKFLFAII